MSEGKRLLTYEEMLQIPPYSLNKSDKEHMLLEQLRLLTKHHQLECLPYQRILSKLNFNSDEIKNLSDVPFLPVRMFKVLDLKSIPDEQVVKTMTSSGTTNQSVSKIYLDKETASKQQKTLVKIVSDFIGKSRLPMLIIDTPGVVKNRAVFSARGAGILGFSIFSSKLVYALKEDMTIDFEAVQSFIDQYKNQPVLVFGFTFMIWEYFYKALLNQSVILNLENGILIHGGGWKKLKDQAVSNHEFSEQIKAVSGISKIHDYYGMVEQTGCVYMQCEEGHLHASIFSEILIRRHTDFSICNVGEKGVIQVLSLIPKSYPGHSLLTEDEGVLLGEDDCPCGRLGKYFKVEGRLKNAEVRGCSDTYERK